jgi:hypothetical protein
MSTAGLPRGIMKLSSGYWVRAAKGEYQSLGPFSELDDAVAARNKRTGERVKVAKTPRRERLPTGVYLDITGKLRVRITIDGKRQTYGPFETVTIAENYYELLIEQRKRLKESRKEKRDRDTVEKIIEGLS